MFGESGCRGITVRFFTKERGFTENNSQEFRPSVGHLQNSFLPGKAFIPPISWVD